MLREDGDEGRQVLMGEDKRMLGGRQDDGRKIRETGVACQLISDLSHM